MSAVENVNHSSGATSLELTEPASNPSLDGQDLGSELPIGMEVEPPSLAIQIPARTALTAFNTGEKGKGKDVGYHETDKNSGLPPYFKKPLKRRSHGEIILHHRSKSVPRVRPPPVDLLNYIPTKVLQAPSTLPPSASGPIRTASSPEWTTAMGETRRHRRSRSLTLLPSPLLAFAALPPVAATPEDVPAPPGIPSSPRPTPRSLPIAELPTNEDNPLQEIQEPMGLCAMVLKGVDDLISRKKRDPYATTMITFANPERSQYPSQVWALLPDRRRRTFQRVLKSIPQRSRRVCERYQEGIFSNPKHCRECLRDTLCKNLLVVRAKRRRLENLFDRRRPPSSPHCHECALYGRACRNERPTPQVDLYAMNVDLSDSLLFSRGDEEYLLKSPVLRDSDSFDDDADSSGADSPIIRDLDEFDEDGYAGDEDEPMDNENVDDDMEVAALDVV